MSQYPFGELGRQVQNRIQNNLDCKIVVTSYSSTPGLGKTTLSILMARCWDDHGWSAEQKAFMSYQNFYNSYMNEPPGSVLLFDEVENEADSRRSNSSENVGLSQLLATQRVRNIISIYTLPAVSMLDKRIMELADYWINVGPAMQKGKAHPYRLFVNDFSWASSGGTDITPSRITDEFGNKQTITWSDLPEDDPDKAYLDDLKDEQEHLESEYVPESEVEKRVNRAVKDAKRDVRDEIIRGVYNHEEADVSTHVLSDVDAIDLSQQRISQIANGG